MRGSRIGARAGRWLGVLVLSCALGGCVEPVEAPAQDGGGVVTPAPDAGHGHDAGRVVPEPDAGSGSDASSPGCVPVAEVCGDGIDQDCDGRDRACPDTSSLVMGWDRETPFDPGLDPDRTFGTTNEFGLPIAAVSVAGDWDLTGHIRHEYSRRPAVNADGTRAVLFGNTGWTYIHDFDGERWSPGHRIPVPLAEPTWDATDPDLLYFIPKQGRGCTVSSYDAETGDIRELGDLSARVRALFGSSVDACWTKGEGRWSNDTTRVCMMIESHTDWRTRGLIIYDRTTDEIVASAPYTASDPDHVGISPSGDYCIIEGSGGDEGKVAWDGSRFWRLNDRAGHSDVCLDASGRDVLVATHYGEGWIYAYDVATGERTSLVPLWDPPGSGYGAHISCVGSRRGYFLLSTYGSRDRDGAQTYGDHWSVDKLMLIPIEEDPVPINLAYLHREGSEYWAEPQAVLGDHYALFATQQGPIVSWAVDLRPVWEALGF